MLTLFHFVGGGVGTNIFFKKASFFIALDEEILCNISTGNGMSLLCSPVLEQRFKGSDAFGWSIIFGKDLKSPEIIGRSELFE